METTKSKGKSAQSEEYERVSLATTEASRKFALVAKQYRAREIGDAEFLAARAEHVKALAEFDAVYEKEQCK